MLRRRLALALALGAVLVAGTVLVVVNRDDPQQTPRSGTNLTVDIVRFAAGLDDDAPYRPPEPAERRRLVSVLRELEAGKATRGAPDLGYRVRTGVDAETGRSFAFVVNGAGERAWGWYLIDLSAPVRLAVEVPHPNSDLRTEEIGLELYQEVPGSVLMVAGTHRRVADGAGDVAHRTDSMFHAVAADLAERGVPQIQLHGFHDDNLPDTDVVVSPGAGDDGDLVHRVADWLADEDFRVCRSWRDDCGRLTGTTNVQGRDADRRGTPFVHVEISRAIRDDPAASMELAHAMARAALDKGASR